MIFLKVILNIENLLKEFESNFIKFRKICIIGIGAEFRQDDAVGTQLIKDLICRIKELIQSHNNDLFILHGDDVLQYHQFLFINGAVLPEQYCEIIAEFNPDFMIIIDAAIFQGKPGDIIKTDVDSWNYSPVLSHMLPLSQFVSMIKIINSKFCAHIEILGIYAQNIFFGENFSESVQQIKDHIEKFLMLKMLQF